LIREIEFADGDYYLTLNPDVRLESQYIARLVEALERHAAGWGTGKLLLMDAEENPTGKIYSVGHAILRDGYFFNIGYGMTDEGQFEQGREVFGAPGAAALYSAELIEAISQDGEFFDEQMFMYGEDTDVDWRARNHGWRCWYEPSAVACHRGSEAERDLKDDAIVSRYRSVIKNARPRNLAMYNLPVILAHIFLRVIIRPWNGIKLARKVFFSSMQSFTQRRDSVLSSEMDEWFKWSSKQPTQQPKSIANRIRNYSTWEWEMSGR
jgi:GT2 family glycosyltransferase